MEEPKSVWKFDSEFSGPQRFEQLSVLSGLYQMEREFNRENEYDSFKNQLSSFEIPCGNSGYERNNPWRFEQELPPVEKDFGNSFVEVLLAQINKRTVFEIVRKYLYNIVAEKINKIEKEEIPGIPDYLKSSIQKSESK